MRSERFCAERDSIHRASPRGGVRFTRASFRKREDLSHKRPIPLSVRTVELEKENARLTHKLKQAELIIEVQKKVAELLKGSSEEKS